VIHGSFLLPPLHHPTPDVSLCTVVAAAIDMLYYSAIQKSWKYQTHDIWSQATGHALCCRIPVTAWSAAGTPTAAVAYLVPAAGCLIHHCRMILPGQPNDVCEKQLQCYCCWCGHQPDQPATQTAACVHACITTIRVTTSTADLAASGSCTMYRIHRPPYAFSFPVTT
jgi:hypothetical protein